VINNDKNKLAFELVNYLNYNSNTLSVTLTGSYAENFNLNKVGDIDIVVICKKLSKKFFKESIKRIKIFHKKHFRDKKLFINTTFGPIKYYTDNTIVFHLMIYDLTGHLIHTVKSPFTCFDWERSNIYSGKSLKELIPVRKLQLRDFDEARRGYNEYLNDIIKNRISFREYIFRKNKYLVVKKYFKINDLNKRDFIYHIIKYVLINYIKYENGINKFIKNREIENKFFQIVKSHKDLKNYKKLKKLKINKSQKSILKTKKLVINFLRKFDIFIKKQNKVNKVYFFRHKKTKVKKDIFLGQKIDVSINNTKMNKKKFNKLNIKTFFSSPAKRCLESLVSLKKNRQVIISQLLNEIDYGDAEGLNYKSLKRKYPKIITKWNKGIDVKFPNGENVKDVFKRLQLFIKTELIKENKSLNKNVVVMTHNIVLRCLIGNFFNIDRSDWYKINIKYFESYEFVISKNQLIPNIDRNKFQHLFKNINKEINFD